MARKHPILSVLLIVVTIVCLFSFAKSFQAGPALSSIKQFEPKTQEYDSPYPDKGTVEMTHYGAKKESAAPKKDPVSHKPEEVEEEEKRISDVSSTDLDYISSGRPIMAKMPNQTIRAEVGRSGWKLLHTILSQYPEEPTPEEKHTLSTYLKLFSRVYPCRECAEHFQELLKKYPPQLGSREHAVMWGCVAHNDVNKRLGKAEFDCTKIFEAYDCGCGSEEEDASSPDSKKTSGTTKADTKPKTASAPLQKGG